MKAFHCTVCSSTWGYCFSSLHSRYSLISLSRGAGHRFILFSVWVLPDPPCLLWSACSRTMNHLDNACVTWARRSSQFLGLAVCAGHTLNLYQGETLGSNWLPLSPCSSLEAIQVNRLDMSLNILQQVPDLDGLRAKRECQDWKACQGITSRDLGKTLEDLLPTKYLKRFHLFNFSSFLSLSYCKPSGHFT